MNYAVGGYLIMLGVEDLRSRKLPFCVLMISVILSFLYTIGKEKPFMMIINALPGILLCIMAVVLPASIGMGDGMIAVFYGILYGWQKVCFLLVIGFWAAAMIGIVLNLLVKKKDFQLPLVPFLAIAHVSICI